MSDYGVVVQLAAAGADETTRSRLGRISIAGILMWPAFGFNLVYTVGAVIVLAIISLVSRLFETRTATPSTTTTSTTATAPRQVGSLWSHVLRALAHICAPLPSPSPHVFAFVCTA